MSPVLATLVYWACNAEKQECVGKNLLTPYCSPQSLQEGKRICCYCPLLLNYSKPLYLSTSPVIWGRPYSNLYVSHTWPASLGTLGFYHPIPTKWHPNASFQNVQHRDNAKRSDLSHTAAPQLFEGVLVCISLQAAREHAHRRTTKKTQESGQCHAKDRLMSTQNIWQWRTGDSRDPT